VDWSGKYAEGVDILYVCVYVSVRQRNVSVDGGCTVLYTMMSNAKQDPMCQSAVEVMK